MMMDAYGAADAVQNAPSSSALDDFYASDAPQHHMFPASCDTSTQQSQADQLSSPPPPAETRATVCLGGAPPSPSQLSGTLDSHKTPGGAKFAVSQVHGVYLTLHRLVLSRCAPWAEFFCASSFQRPGNDRRHIDSS
ncbi:uncharacterized protein EMH_0032510 [Eimeria mitis]|uniref:Uncharacterized protein n=1 Tax=Eimeria mitis TaxID=44415 RepID=U6JPY0_9EIME|nr:uncharacterized protein EMH_0032510 [Eimeria mitis]CDJ27519.1 hypothetical protein, conserved [Eimeria mitis]